MIIISWAHDVEISGIYYNLIEKVMAAEVTFKGSTYGEFDEYSGSLVIPSFITHNDKTYSVTKISKAAFEDCHNLTSVTIPNSVTSIGSSAFYGCNGLTSVSIPNSVTTIDSHAFSCCSSLSSITIPNSVTTIGNYAFWNCTGLPSVTIPNSVTTIGEGAFWCCNSLISVIIPNSVMTIGARAFSGCTDLISITIPNSMTNIEIEAFANCEALISVSIPNSVTSIGTSAFKGCSSLTSLTIPSSVTRIGGGAFSRCGLISITIPNSVTRIDYSAFENCTKMKSIIIGNAVTLIGNDAFAGSKEIETVYCFAEIAPSLQTDVFKESYIDYATLYVPASALQKYKSTSQWNDFKNIESIEGTETGASGAADIFRFNNSAVLGKNTGSVTSSDLVAIYKALEDYNQLADNVKADLVAEKALLDSLKSKAESLKAAEEAEKKDSEDISTFRTTYADILGKSILTITSAELETVNNALSEYETLSAAAKAKLKVEKNLLESLKLKSEELGGTDPQICTVPQITFADKTLTLSCSTPHSQIHYYYYLSNVGEADAENQITAVTKSTNALTIMAYATAEGLTKSKTVIQTFPFNATINDINGDNKITISDVTALIDIIVNQ